MDALVFLLVTFLFALLTSGHMFVLTLMSHLKFGVAAGVKSVILKHC